MAPREKPGCADVREKANANFRHREDPVFAGDAMRTMRGDADPAAHHNAVDQRNVGFGILFDRSVEPIFCAEECKRLGLPAGASEVIDFSQVAARAKRPAGRRGHDHTGDRGIIAPLLELRT